MKKFLALFSIGVIAASSYLYIANASGKKESDAEKNEVNHEGMEEDAQERMRWEVMRLADPSGRIPDNIRQKELAFAATLPNDAGIASRMPSPLYTNRGPWNVG